MSRANLNAEIFWVELESCQVCEESYIEALGMAPNEPDWNTISRDWVNPMSRKAFQRLNKKWLAIKLKDQPKKA